MSMPVPFPAQVDFHGDRHITRWRPLVQWLLAIAAVFAILAGLVGVLFTGEYPEGIREYLVGVYRYALRVEAYVGLLTDTYPPFRLVA